MLSFACKPTTEWLLFTPLDMVLHVIHESVAEFTQAFAAWSGLPTRIFSSRGPLPALIR